MSTLSPVLCICNLPNDLQKNSFHTHCEGYHYNCHIVLYSSSSPVICFICVVYDIVYQMLNISSQIYHLTIAKVSVSLP